MHGITLRNIIYGLLLLAGYNSAHAAISLSSTRLIFDEASKEASITSHNAGTQEILLQSWLEYENKAAKDIPFNISPTLARLKADTRQVLRVLYLGTGMPHDKESVLWLNAQEIPQVTQEENTLQIAVRQRIKVFYRPKGLKGSANDAPSLLTWQLGTQDQKTYITLKNPTAYHVSMLSLEGITLSEAFTGKMFNPGESVVLPVEHLTNNQTPTVLFKTINDWGAQTPYKVRLDFNQPNTASEVTEQP